MCAMNLCLALACAPHYRVRQALVDGSADERSANQLAALLAGLSMASSSGPPTGQAAQQQQQQQQQQPTATTSASNVEVMDTDDAQLASSSNAALTQARVAGAEGASYTCSACGGIVALARRDTHEQLWCPGPRD